MYTFWEIKENVATKKTDMQFHSFDHIIGFLSFWFVDLMCHTTMLNWEFPPEMVKKNQLSFQLNW